MSYTCRRKAEMIICAALNNAGVKVKFYPAKGDKKDAAVEVPYGVVTFDGGEKMFADEDTYTFPGKLAVVTHLGDTRGEQHDALVSAVEGVLDTIQRGLYQDQQFVLHGLDYDPGSSVSDDEQRSHADVIEMEITCTG